MSLLEETGHEWLRPSARWVAGTVPAARGSGRRPRSTPGWEQPRRGDHELMVLAAGLARAKGVAARADPEAVLGALEPGACADPLRRIRCTDRTRHIPTTFESWWATLPIYVYRCDCGLSFERLLPRDSEAPACPECGGATRKIPAGPSLGGRAGERPAQGSVTPQARGLQAGGPERMKREVEFRQRLEAKQAENPARGGAGTSPASAGT